MPGRQRLFPVTPAGAAPVAAASAMFAGIIALVLLAACTAPAKRAEAPVSQVLFVCEHGNVKSLMAASYFNQRAQERGLPFRAVSRGSAPNSNTVPPAIVENLRGDGFDVAAFHPIAVSRSDVSASRLVVTIGIELPTAARVAGMTPEQWNDVPPASVDYGAARASLRNHVERLVEELAQAAATDSRWQVPPWPRRCQSR